MDLPEARFQPWWGEFVFKIGPGNPQRKITIKIVIGKKFVILLLYYFAVLADYNAKIW